MSSSSSVLHDESKLSKIDRFVFTIESFLALISGVVIVALVFLAVTNVLGRWFFNSPVSGYIDWVEQFMAIFAFLGIAYCQRIGGHIRMDIVIGKLKTRALWISEFVSTFLMLVITVILVYGSYLHFLRAYQNGDSSIDIGLSIWPAKLIIPLALATLALRLVIQLWGYARAFNNNSEYPVAVPLIEDASTQARNEAARVE